MCVVVGKKFLLSDSGIPSANIIHVGPKIRSLTLYVQIVKKIGVSFFVYTSHFLGRMRMYLFDENCLKRVIPRQVCLSSVRTLIYEHQNKL